MTSGPIHRRKARGRGAFDHLNFIVLGMICQCCPRAPCPLLPMSPLPLREPPGPQDRLSKGTPHQIPEFQSLNRRGGYTKGCNFSEGEGGGHHMHVPSHGGPIGCQHDARAIDTRSYRCVLSLDSHAWQEKFDKCDECVVNMQHACFADAREII